MGTIFRYRAFDPRKNGYVEWSSEAVDAEGASYRGETPFKELEDVLMVRRIETLEEGVMPSKLTDVLDADLAEGDVWSIEYEESPGVIVRVNGFIINGCLCPTTKIPLSAMGNGAWARIGNVRQIEREDCVPLRFDESGYPVIDNSNIRKRASWELIDFDVVSPGSWRLEFDLEIMSRDNSPFNYALLAFGVQSSGANQDGEIWSAITVGGRSIKAGTIDEDGEFHLSPQGDWGAIKAGKYSGSFACITKLQNDGGATLQFTTTLEDKESGVILMSTDSVPMMKSMGSWGDGGSIPMVRFRLEATSVSTCGTHFIWRGKTLNWSSLQI